MKEGIILLSHGSKSTIGQKELKSLAKAIQEQSNKLVIGTTLEFGQPNFWTGLSYLVEEVEVGRILIIPLFVFSGKHVKGDIPRLIKKAEVKYPKVDFKLKEHLGGSDLFRDMIINMIKED
ncbi:sirohydrochlorin chelatase [Halonatronum saccharophilum]|uniref:sirohydrochlorin chelatase n=1 Tax=Halonatronum saccharophilum TaxID=150060 RepID=UPI0004869DDA|nr:CbiX/SirB N-terminal domain-containing protein [Halonatronum saccharophilum]